MQEGMGSGLPFPISQRYRGKRGRGWGLPFPAQAHTWGKGARLEFPRKASLAPFVKTMVVVSLDLNGVGWRIGLAWLRRPESAVAQANKSRATCSCASSAGL
jgi:hypothetical protein